MRSYASCESTLALTGQTIGEALAATAARLPDGLALVSRHQDVRLTWSELAARVEDVARGILRDLTQKGLLRECSRRQRASPQEYTPNAASPIAINTSNTGP